MRRVSENEFFKFIKAHSKQLKVKLDTDLDPPIVSYIHKETGEIYGKYPEISLSEKPISIKKLVYEVKDC